MTHETMRRLDCPYCDHFLEFRPEDSDVAALAMTSHLQRRHSTQWPQPEVKE